MGLQITITNEYINGVCEDYRIYTGTTYNIADAVYLATDPLNPSFVFNSGDFNSVVGSDPKALYIFVEHCDGHLNPPPVHEPLLQGGFQVMLVEVPHCCDYPELTATPIPTSTPLNTATPTPTPTEIPGDPASCDEGMDVIFLLDYTGSMGNAINGIKNEVTSIVNTIITESNNDYRLGLVIYDEWTSPTITSYSAKPAYTTIPSAQRFINQGLNSKYQWITAVEKMGTNNEVSFTNKLALLNTPDFPLGYGVGGPEPADMGIDLIATNNVSGYGYFDGTFRSGVSKLIVLITDAQPSGNDDIYNQVDIDFVNGLIPQLYNQNIRLLLMATSGNNVLYDLATGTNGVISNTFSAQSIITTIQNICTEVTPTPTETPLPTPTPYPTATPTSTPAPTPTNTPTPTPTITTIPPTETPTNTPTPTATNTPTPTTGNTLVASAGGGMEPCIGGTIDDYMSAGVYLTAPVTVETNFDVTVWYKDVGNSCSFPNITTGAYSTSFTVTVLAGESSGDVDACTRGQYFPSGANICGACVTGSDNTIDTITFNNPGCQQ
jgi:hypothetical protein